MYLMNRSVGKGRIIVIISIFAFLGFSIIDLITYALNISNVGMRGMVSQIFQVIIHLVFSYYLYRGRKFAKIIAGIVLILDSVAYLIRIAEGVIAAVPISVFMIYIGIAFIVKCISGILLISSKNVTEFMEFQADKYKMK